MKDYKEIKKEIEKNLEEFRLMLLRMIDYGWMNKKTINNEWGRIFIPCHLINQIFDKDIFDVYES